MPSSGRVIPSFTNKVTFVGDFGRSERWPE
jgi:hypothetical protein